MFEDGSYAAGSGGEDWGVGEAEVGVETCLLTARQFILFIKEGDLHILTALSKEVAGSHCSPGAVYQLLSS